MAVESELDKLAGAAERLAAAVVGRQDICERSASLAARLRGRRFNICVLGEFKRGKSTLINALLGSDLLPTGALPLTSVVTEVSYGPEGATVLHLDASTEEIGLAQLAEYVTEARNPDNVRQVARVEVRVPVALLEPGLVLVDTPGTGSLFGHDEVAARALLEADGAIVVLSADAPLSEQELRLLSTLSHRQAPTFFVLNRLDHLGPGEREEVLRFVSEKVAAELGRPERLWALSARAALGARLAGALAEETEAGEFASFYRAFSRFVDEELVAARLSTARAELGRLACELNDAVAIETASAELDVRCLAERVERLRTAAEEQRQAFLDERTLLERDVASLARKIELALADFAQRQPAKCFARLEEVARAAPISKLEDMLQRAVEELVRESFESFREAEAAQAEHSWRTLAARFRDRTEAHLNAVRAAAADIFQVELPHVDLPEVAEERERYFYLFLYVGSSTEGVERLLRRLLPAPLARRRLLERARRELAAEFDKHAGRARWDLTQRLGSVRRRFEVAMAAELERSIATVVQAAVRAEQLHALAEAEREEARSKAEAAKRAARGALELVAGRWEVAK